MPLMKVRKKPVEVEAFPVREALQCAARDWYSLPKWMIEAYDKGLIVFGNTQMTIKTLEGTHLGEVNDFIIRGVKGELYPIKPEIFAETYEQVIA